MVCCGKLGDNGMNRQESAETLALKVLTWLVTQPEELGAFMAASGASVGDLATLAGNAGFLGALLDFLLEQDARVIAFCDSEGIAYDAPMAARMALPGGQQTHWT
jgi:hypothetical protein